MQRVNYKAPSPLHPLILIGNFLILWALVVGFAVGSLVSISQGAVAMLTIIFVWAGISWVVADFRAKERPSHRSWVFGLALTGTAISMAFWHPYALSVPFLGIVLKTAHGLAAACLAGFAYGLVLEPNLRGDNA